jgi:hypothetical protein
MLTASARRATTARTKTPAPRSPVHHSPFDCPAPGLPARRGAGGGSAVILVEEAGTRVRRQRRWTRPYSSAGAAAGPAAEAASDVSRAGVGSACSRRAASAVRGGLRFGRQRRGRKPSRPELPSEVRNELAQTRRFVASAVDCGHAVQVVSQRVVGVNGLQDWGQHTSFGTGRSEGLQLPTIGLVQAKHPHQKVGERVVLNGVSHKDTVWTTVGRWHLRLSFSQTVRRITSKKGLEG